jgi:hypothetical protein
VAQAAQALGVTRDAIHKRISRGSIEYEKGEDGRFYVYVDPSTSGLDESVDESKDESTVEAGALISAKDDLIATLREQLQAERRANEENRRIIAALTQRIPELPAPRGDESLSYEPRESPVSPGPGDTATDTTDAGEGPQSGTERPQEQRSWWSRIFGS